MKDDSPSHRWDQMDRKDQLDQSDPERKKDAAKQSKFIP